MATGYPDSEVLGAFLGTLKTPSSEKYLILAASTHALGIEREWVKSHFRSKNHRGTSEFLERLLDSYRGRNTSEYPVPPLSLDSPKIKILPDAQLGSLAVEALHGRERLSEKSRTLLL
jgi:hypothetical protein